MSNINLIHLKTERLLRYYYSVHGNLVTEAVKYVSRKLNAKYELYMILAKRVIKVSLCSSCHGDLVSTATRYVACDAYHLQEYLMPNMISI